jgi:hypothetical protein
MTFEMKCMSGVTTSFSDTEVTVYTHVHLSSANRTAADEKNSSDEVDQLSDDRLDAMQQGGAPSLHPYVLLNFSFNSEVGCKFLPVAVVFHKNTVPIIMIRHNWQVSLDAENREYLSEVLDNWMKTPPERVLALFRQLESLSTGPIRVTVSGIATAEGLEHLMYAVLTHAGVRGQRTM